MKDQTASEHSVCQTVPIPKAAPRLSPIEQINARIRSLILTARTRQARAYIKSLVGKEGSVLVNGSLGAYGKAVLESTKWQSAQFGKVQSADIHIFLDLPKLSINPKSGSLFIFTLDAKRPDLTQKLIKAISRTPGFEFNLSAHWSEAPTSSIWISGAKLSALLSGLQQDTYLLMRKKQSVL